jgi:hypothetical protein
MPLVCPWLVVKSAALVTRTGSATRVFAVEKREEYVDMIATFGGLTKSRCKLQSEGQYVMPMVEVYSERDSCGAGRPLLRVT